MTFWSHLRSLFGHIPQNTSEYMTVDAIFKFLLSHVKEQSELYTQTSLVLKAHTVAEGERAKALLRAYFDLEHFIVSHAPPVVDRVYTEPILRQKVREMLGGRPLPSVFTLVFLPPLQQEFEVYATAIENLALFLENYVGSEKTKSILNTVMHGTQLQGALVRPLGEGYDREKTLGNIQPAQYKRIYAALFEQVGALLGPHKALEQSRRDYEFFKATYDASITSKFLSILPESILELEQLAFMSREDLERKITERTEELRVLNAELEKKVLERTEELKQKVDELFAANEHLLELDQVKTEFISVAAHQLRTPLTALKWSLSLLGDEQVTNLTQEQRALIKNGYESNERMISLINEMLTVMRIESGEMLYEFAPVQIEDLIQSVLLEFTALGNMRDMQLVYEKPEKLLPRVTADADKMRSVVQNLLENALNYGSSGTHVVVSTLVEGSFIKVLIADKGIGIPRAQQASIFDKFFRADNAMSVRTEGSGLGLFIAKSIIEKHGGTIGFDSQEGQGSTFYFTLPVIVDNAKTN